MRYGTNRVNTKRSKCFSCGKKLTIFNLIPILSWIWQKGRCDSCFSKISWRYPAIELITAGLFGCMFLISFSVIGLIYNLILAFLLVFLIVTDIDTFTIPHSVSIPLNGLSLFGLGFNFFTLEFAKPELWEVLAGPILALFFWGIWAGTRGRAMGFADGTLALSIGWLLGLSGGISAVFIAFWIGALVSVGVILWQAVKSANASQKLSRKSPVPFGPFLVLGFLIVYLTGITVI